MTSAAPDENGAVALTGATGFVGRALLDRFLEGGRPVRCLVRNPSSYEAESPARVITGDLDNQSALDELVAGAETVVHCAAALGGMARGDLHRINVIGTARLARAAEKAGVRRYILASSLAAREPGLSDYAATKRAAEQAARNAGDRMQVVTLRLPAIYGPGDRNTAPLMQAMQMGLLPEPGRDARFSLLYVDDAADALAAAVGASGDPSGVYEVSGGGEACSWRSLAAAASRVCGRRVRLVATPRPVADLAADLSGFTARMTGRPSIFTRGKVRELFHPDWTVSDDAYTRATGWRAGMSLERGLTRTLETF